MRVPGSTKKRLCNTLYLQSLYVDWYKVMQRFVRIKAYEFQPAFFDLEFLLEMFTDCEVHLIKTPLDSWLFLMDILVNIFFRSFFESETLQFQFLIKVPSANNWF